jgi:hypothetical protein
MAPVEGLIDNQIKINSRVGPKLGFCADREGGRAITSDNLGGGGVLTKRRRLRSDDEEFVFHLFFNFCSWLSPLESA